MTDIHIIGIGKDAYNSSLEQMVDGNHLPWVEDSSASGYPVWSSWNATQRSIYILGQDGIQDTTFNITPYTDDDSQDYSYLMYLILLYRNNGGSQTILIPDDFSEVQTGIDMAQNGDLILLEPGTYYEQINFLGKNITVGSLFFHKMNSDYIGESVLDGQGIGSVITIENGEGSNSKIMGLTIKNGNSSNGAGLIIANQSNPVIEKNHIIENIGFGCGAVGGGLAIMNGSSPKIISNMILNNSVMGPCDCICYFGGGIFVDSTSTPIVGGAEGLGNIFFENYGDYGHQLFRQLPIDTTGWQPLNGQFNTFENCPPDFIGDVYPANGWDVSHCYSFLTVTPNSTPSSFNLFSAYPNPFNESITISFRLFEDQFTQMNIFDLSGKLVDKILNDYKKIGNYTITWNANNYASGIYIVQLNFGDAQVSQKVLLLK